MKKKINNNILKGHEKNTENQEKNTDFPISSGENEQKSLLYKKTEKLTTAVYIITGFLSDNEPLKWKLRTHSLSFFSLAVSFIKADYTSAPYQERNVDAALADMLSCLELAQRTNLVSSMNFSILYGEYRKIGESIESRLKRGIGSGDFSLSEVLFQSPPSLSGENNQEISWTNLFIKSDDKRQNRGQKNKNSHAGYRGDALKDIQKIEKINASPDFLKGRNNHEMEVNFREKTKQEERSRRRLLILKLLKAQGELSIKDISSIAPAYSEKTIQRDLTALIEKGYVRRKGKRRWSTYALSGRAGRLSR